MISVFTYISNYLTEFRVVYDLFDSHGERSARTAVGCPLPARGIAGEGSPVGRRRSGKGERALADS
jgi:hypothetical protein